MSDRWPIAITGYAEVDPSTLRPNLGNWRRHPQRQRDSMADVLNEVGFAGAVLVNTVTGNIVDGHMRVEMALAEGQSQVPVLYCALTEQQERRALATFDPLGAMAEADETALQRLLAELEGDPAADVYDPPEIDGPVGSSAGTAGGTPDPEPHDEERFALEIVLTTADHRRWQAYKREIGCERDQTAFLRLLESV